MDLVQEAFSDLVFYHYFFSAFFLLPFVLNLYTLWTYKNFADLNKKIWFRMPLIFFLLVVSLLSGLNVMMTLKVFFSPTILAMICLWIFVLGAEILRLRMLKVARRTNEEAMLKYVLFCKVIYIIDSLAFVAVFFGSF